ncbi:MAG: hypothetical protein WA188_07785 [Terriglobales bacterium]
MFHLGRPQGSATRTITAEITDSSYKSQVPGIEQAIRYAALMLGSDKSQGYCLEMIYADFLAGAHLEGGSPTVLLPSMMRLFRLLHPAASRGIPRES